MTFNKARNGTRKRSLWDMLETESVLRNIFWKDIKFMVKNINMWRLSNSKRKMVSNETQSLHTWDASRKSNPIIVGPTANGSYGDLTRVWWRNMFRHSMWFHFRFNFFSFLVLPGYVDFIPSKTKDPLPSRRASPLQDPVAYQFLNWCSFTFLFDQWNSMAVLYLQNEHEIIIFPIKIYKKPQVLYFKMAEFQYLQRTWPASSNPWLLYNYAT